MKTAAIFSSIAAVAASAACTNANAPVTGPKMYQTIMFGGVEVIDTPVVREVRNLVKTLFTPFLYKHVARTDLVDVEAHAVATLMHDMGWDMTPNSPWFTLDNCFEVDGLNGALKNMNLQTSTVPTVNLIVNSIQLDNPGVEYPGISNQTLNTIFATLPNFDIAAGANETSTWMCEIKPDYTYGTIEEQFGTAYVPGYNATGHHAFDIIVDSILTKSSHVPRPVNN
ncbi:hypothetical protein F5Y16DRAFT_412371 [Xylariaceae sp. FL0255]|nr:hypothetical protein F5Y16DRAFT_412371 [Xylariaceae sp. FL0255]